MSCDPIGEVAAKRPMFGWAHQRPYSILMLSSFSDQSMSAINTDHLIVLLVSSSYK